MQGVTFTLAIIVSLLVITLRPEHALAAYITSLLWYPSYLAISIGTIDILIGRFVIGILILRCLCDDRIRGKLTWCRLDTLVALSMAVYVGSYFITLNQTFSLTIESRGGFLMDTWFAYMAARFVITDRAKLMSVIKWIGIALVPLAILGVIESVSGWQPFAPLWRFSPWYSGGAFISRARYGFARAVGPFSHAILFGGGFAMFLPLIYYLRYEKNDWHQLAYVFSGIAVLGALSSLSSGPWIMVILVIFCLIVERHKVLIKPLLIFFLLLCILTEITSDRHFYYPLTNWINVLGGAGWHRARLIDVAFQHFGEWWLYGYGSVDPGWGHFFGMPHTDVTNEYILMGVRYGVFGMVALCLVLATAFRRIIFTYKRMTHPAMKSLCWAFGSFLFAVTVSWMSVSFFGQLTSLFYCTLGMIGSLCNTGFDWQLQNRLSLGQNYPASTVSQISND